VKFSEFENIGREDGPGRGTKPEAKCSVRRLLEKSSRKELMRI